VYHVDEWDTREIRHNKPNEHWVHYSSDETWCTHDLKIHAYGLDQVWRPGQLELNQ
jgi:hypothetical protein